MINIFKQRFKTTEQRFWEKVKKGETDECWEWQARRDKDGYGHFEYTHGNNRAAHRVAWLLSFGSDPGKLLVCHTCDNPSCCNPNHLFLGTAKDNNMDATRKGHNKGNRKTPSNAKFTSEQVEEIRRKYIPRVYTTIMLAEEYGISTGHVHNILTKKLYRG